MLFYLPVLFHLPMCLTARTLNGFIYTILATYRYIQFMPKFDLDVRGIYRARYILRICRNWVFLSTWSTHNRLMGSDRQPVFQGWNDIILFKKKNNFNIKRTEAFYILQKHTCFTLLNKICLLTITGTMICCVRIHLVI